MGMIYIKQAQQEHTSTSQLPLIAGNNSYLGDLLNSDAPPDKQLSAGFFRQLKGEPLKYKYDYDEMKICVEGGMRVSDGTQTVDAKPGDIFYFHDGDEITFDTDDYALNFFVGLRPKGQVYLQFSNLNPSIALFICIAFENFSLWFFFVIGLVLRPLW
ncbi:uncharacterized protein YALI1_D02936g [Yarrowia lipolytica]|nr:hypothetical protein YALI1_D02936g [Yarrowia lipolytica]